MLVVIQVSAEGLYLPPVFSEPLLLSPPHTIISLPVQTAACLSLASGALIVLVTVQVSVAGTYLPPLLPVPPVASSPPQMTISLPVHTAVCSHRPTGGFATRVATQVLLAGSYSSATVQRTLSTEDDHFASGPYGRMIGSRGGCVYDAGSYPTIGGGIVSPAGVAVIWESVSAPNNHLASGPNGCMQIPCSGCIG